MDINRDHETWHDPAVASACKAFWAGRSERSSHERFAALCAEYYVPGYSLLDAGCGTGLLYGNLGKQGYRYVGVDIAEPMLEIARADYPDGLFLKGDLYNLPMADSSFDIVACAAVLGHIPDIARPLAEMVRVARRQVIFTVWPVPSGVKEDTEVLFGHRALHRSFSEEYIEQSGVNYEQILRTIDWGAERAYVIGA